MFNVDFGWEMFCGGVCACAPQEHWTVVLFPVLPLSGFGIMEMLASWNELGAGLQLKVSV